MTRSFQRRQFLRQPSQAAELRVVETAPSASEVEPVLIHAEAQNVRTDDAPARSTPPVYYGDFRHVTSTWSARAGMSVKLGILDRSFTDLHPFKGLSYGKESGQRFRLWIARHGDEDLPVDQAEVVYKGEAVLMFWSDDPTGMTVKFLLDDGPDGVNGKHPFEGIPYGSKEGEKLQGACWAVSDDESVQHPKQIKRKTPFYALSEKKQANILCRDTRFISFLKENEARLLDGEISDIDVYADGPGFAADVVRKHLGIESRADLGDDNMPAERARMKWARLLDAYELQKSGYRR